MKRTFDTTINSLESGDRIKVPGFASKFTVNKTSVVHYRSGNGGGAEVRRYVDFVEAGTCALVAPGDFLVEVEVDVSR